MAKKSTSLWCVENKRFKKFLIFLLKVFMLRNKMWLFEVATLN